MNSGIGSLTVLASIILFFCFPNAAFAISLLECGISNDQVSTAIAPVKSEYPRLREFSKRVADGEGTTATTLTGEYAAMADPKTLAFVLLSELNAPDPTEPLEQLNKAARIISIAGLLGEVVNGSDQVLAVVDTLKTCGRLTVEEQETVSSIEGQIVAARAMLARARSMSQSQEDLRSSSSEGGFGAKWIENFYFERYGNYRNTVAQELEQAKKRDAFWASSGAGVMQSEWRRCLNYPPLDNSLDEDTRYILDLAEKTAREMFSYVPDEELEPALEQLKEPCALIAGGAVKEKLSGIPSPAAQRETYRELEGSIATVAGLSGLRGSAKIESTALSEQLLKDVQSLEPQSVARIQRIADALNGRQSGLGPVYRDMLTLLDLNKGAASRVPTVPTLTTVDGIFELSQRAGLPYTRAEVAEQMFSQNIAPDLNAEIDKIADNVESRFYQQAANVVAGAVGYFIIERKVPGFLDTVVDADDHMLPEIQSALTPEEALVFFETNANTVLTSIAVTREGVFAANAVNDIEIVSEDIADIRQLISAQISGEYSAINQEALSSLYQNLVGQLGAEVLNKKRLTFVSDSFVQAVAFDALRMPDGRYLLQEYEISLTPSIASFVQGRSRQTSARPLKSLAMISDPNFRGNSQLVLRALSGGFGTVKSACKLPPVPQTGKIADTLAVYLSVEEGADLRRSQASELSLRQAMLTSPWRTADVLAFNTHGLLGGQMTGRLSGEPSLVLSPPEGACPPSTPLALRNDGFLTASEIYEFDFDAELVLLTACNTAAVDENIGEPLSGLARAFLSRGANSILVSNWESQVGDRFTDGPTELFISEFLKHYSNGDSIYAAVRKAKLVVLADFPHPAAWANFALISSRR